MRLSLPWGYIEFSNNEVSIISTVDDPPKVRLASVSGALGAISWNRIRPDGVQEEMVLLQGKQDERHRGTPDVLSGELTLHVRDHFGAGDGMVKVLEARHDGVWIGRLTVDRAWLNGREVS